MDKEIKAKDFIINSDSKFKNPLQLEFEREFLLSIPVYFKDSRIEKFCHLVALEMKNATEAFITAYPDSKANNKTIWERASRLANRPEVLRRIHQLRVPIAAKSALLFDELCRELKEVATDTREKVQNARIKAIELSFKLLGINFDDNRFNLNIESPNNITLNFDSKDKDL
ncbi:MAG: hypothetical protein LBD46_07850 [Endomicrobium sp.]|jgi:hypothetical protein|nr:hypothetical protein [Endomicrobium sp.]